MFAMKLLCFPFFCLKILVQLGAEQLLESEIGVRIDVSLASFYSHCRSSLGKNCRKVMFFFRKSKGKDNEKCYFPPANLFFRPLIRTFASCKAKCYSSIPAEPSA